MLEVLTQEEILLLSFQKVLWLNTNSLWNNELFIVRKEKHQTARGKKNAAIHSSDFKWCHLTISSNINM